MSSVTCYTACGASFDPELLPAGQDHPPAWDYLELSKRYRCAACRQDLLAARSYPGVPETGGADTLPPGQPGRLARA